MSEKIRAAGFFLTEQAVIEGDVLKDVVLLGPTSTNGNEYSADALKSAVPHLRDRAVYVDHDLKSKMRRMDERFGQTIGDTVRFVESDHDGKPRVRGSIRFLQSHPMAVRVKEACEKGLGFFGCSFVADAVGRKEGNKRFVEQITRVASLDIVDRAATGTLVEQEDLPADPAAEHQAGLDQMVLAICHGEGTPADKAKKIQTLLETMAPGDKPAPGAAPPPMSEATLRKVTGELVEQAVAKALTTALPQLVEQETQRRAAAAQYVKPTTQPPGGPPAPAPQKDSPPTDPAARKKWLHSN